MRRQRIRESTLATMHECGERVGNARGRFGSNGSHASHRFISASYAGSLAIVLHVQVRGLAQQATSG